MTDETKEYLLPSFKDNENFVHLNTARYIERLDIEETDIIVPNHFGIVESLVRRNFGLQHVYHLGYKEHYKQETWRIAINRRNGFYDPDPDPVERIQLTKEGLQKLISEKSQPIYLREPYNDKNLSLEKKDIEEILRYEKDHGHIIERLQDNSAIMDVWSRSVIWSKIKNVIIEQKPENYVKNYNGNDFWKKEYIAEIKKVVEKTIDIQKLRLIGIAHNIHNFTKNTSDSIKIADYIIEKSFFSYNYHINHHPEILPDGENAIDESKLSYLLEKIHELRFWIKHIPNRDLEEITSKIDEMSWRHQVLKDKITQEVNKDFDEGSTYEGLNEIYHNELKRKYSKSNRKPSLSELDGEFE